MWLEQDLIKVGNNFLDTDVLSNLINKLDPTNPMLNRPGPLAGSTVIFNKQYFPDEQFIHGRIYEGVELEIHNLSYLMVEEVKERYLKSYTVLKSEVSICPPGVVQEMHIDPRLFHRASKRIHIPIKTNKDAFLEIEDKKYFLDPLFIWEFNNIKIHRAGNLGTESRTHIIVDFIDNDVLNGFLSTNHISELYKIVDPSRKFL